MVSFGLVFYFAGKTKPEAYHSEACPSATLYLQIREVDPLFLHVVLCGRRTYPLWFIIHWTENERLQLAR